MTLEAKARRAGSAAGPLGLSRSELDPHTIAQNRFAAQARSAAALSRLRRQRLVEHLHRLGPAPLAHFIREVELATGRNLTAQLERYGEIDPEFVRALGGNKFAPIVPLIDGSRAIPTIDSRSGASREILE
jgi:hypothetical protein